MRGVAGDSGEGSGRPTDFLGLFLVCSIILVVAFVAQWEPEGSEAMVLTANGHLTGCDVPFQMRDLFVFLCPPMLLGAVAGLLGFIQGR